MPNTYSVILLDTDGTELSRQDDMRSLKAAKLEAKAVAADMEYKNSSPGAVQVQSEGGAIHFAVNHVVREREIMAAQGIEPYATRARFARACEGADTFGKQMHLLYEKNPDARTVSVDLSGGYDVNEIRCLLRELEAVQAAVGYNNEVEAPDAR